MAINDNLGDKLLTIGEAAKYLGVSIDTLRRWEVRGRITPYRSPGGHRYYIREDLDKLFNKRYTRDEFSEPIKKGEPVEEISEATTSEPQIIEPEPPNTTDTVQTLPSVNETATQPEIEVPKETPAVVIEPPQERSLLEPIPIVTNQNVTMPSVTTPITIDTADTQNQKLKEILGEKKENKPTTGELILILAVILFVGVDVFLFLRWYASTNIVVPIP